MFKDKCISITDLRTKTKHCLENLDKEPKYIFINNKPVAVLIDIDEYEKKCGVPELNELPMKEVNEKLKKEAEKAKKTNKKNLINI